MIKCLVYETRAGASSSALLRGDLEVNEVALKNALGVDAPGARLRGEGREPRRARRSASSGRTSCRPRSVRIIADESDPRRRQRRHRRRPTRLARRGLRRCARDANVQELGRLRAGARRRSLPALRQAARRSRAGIEVGHIFKLGTKYSKALHCEFTDEKGETAARDHGHATASASGRTMAAAVEQHHDADGIVWPLALAPFEIALVSLNPTDEATRDAADALYDGARRGRARGLLRRPRRAARREVQGRRPDRLPDPRQRRRARALKEGKVEVVLRRDKSVRPVPVAEALEAVEDAARRSSAGK